jgi:RimJ/RimL family protein N-acetyltransferase
MLETERLFLRPFRETDREAFARLNGDPRVSDWLGGPIDRAASDALIDRTNVHIAEHGFGFWAAERKADGVLVGMIGLRHTPFDTPMPGLELGWRLDPAAQGQGLASEGAKASLDWGFANLAAREILAFTARSNLRSQAVMKRIGMIPDPARDFDHPRLAADHPLRPHVVYVAARP